MTQKQRTIYFLGISVPMTVLVIIFVVMRGHSAGKFPPEFFEMSLEGERAAREKIVGRPMPEISLTDWRNTEGIKLEDLKGKVVVLDFWGTFCAPCIAAFPKNDSLYAKYKSQGVEFLGICTNERQENYDRVLAAAKPQYPMGRDAELKTMKAWSAESYPLYVLVDRNGIVRAMGLKHEYLEPAIQMLLAEPAWGTGAAK